MAEEKNTVTGKPATYSPEELEKTGRRASRRNFIKKVFSAGVALTSTGVLAKKVSSLVPAENVQDKYLKDVLPGDRVLKSRKYVLMTDKEKRELIRFFTENYKRQS